MSHTPLYEPEEETQSIWGQRHSWHLAVKVREELQWRVRGLRFHNSKPFIPTVAPTSYNYEDLEQFEYDRFCSQVDERQTAF